MGKLNRNFKILYISSEVTPFAKTGGLADVSGALPKVLLKMGHDIRVMMPKYGTIFPEEYAIKPLADFGEMAVRIGNVEKIACIRFSHLPLSDVIVYFVENDGYFKRPELYRNPETNQDWEDNAERFTFFCLSALQFLKSSEWRPDIIHCNDWQTCLIPLYLKEYFGTDPFYKNIAVLLTIHNIAYQGIFDLDFFKLTDLPEYLFEPLSGIEYWGKANFLKAGIVYSDLLNTVSETYAKEIQSSEEYGYGLEGVLKERSDDLYGIINGIDYSVWNPEIDPYIPHNYSKDHLSGKRENKKTLLGSHDLSFDENIPLIGIISRLADQKGFDLIAEIMDELMKLDLYIILLGRGDEKYHQLFTRFKSKFPQKIGINLSFDDRLAHLIEAGSDIFLMPSKYEPCGLNQLYSLKYGTIPIVRATGGLADTIQEFNPSTCQGTGFTFKDYTGKALLTAIRRALGIYQRKEVWLQVMHNSMMQNFSWDRSAQKYTELYRKLLR